MTKVQSHDTIIASSFQRPQTQKDINEIEEIKMDAPFEQTFVALSRNQSRLDRRLTKIEHNVSKTNKKLNSIKGFLNKIWDKLSCSSSSTSVIPPTSSTRVTETPALFAWTTTEEEDEDE